MSPRAACRLESLGFEEIYDYSAGIAEWSAAGLPLEGSTGAAIRVADATRPDVPVAEISESLGRVHARVAAAGWDEAVVVDCDGVVAGRLRGGVWDEDPSRLVDEVMETGPTTVRPDGDLSSLAARMDKRGTQLVIVTDPQGVLIGVVLREEAARLVSGEPPEKIWRECDGCPGRWSTPSR